MSSPVYSKMEDPNCVPWRTGFYKFPPLYRFHAVEITGSIGAVKFVMEHDMLISIKSGHFTNPDDRGLDVSGKTNYNVEVSTTEPGVPIFHAIVYNDGNTWTFSDGVSGDWMNKETFNNLKEEEDPCDEYPCDYVLKPDSPGKLLWISGLTGTGKSTVSLHLKNEYGYILYEGDCFAAGYNPYVGSAPKALTPHGTRKLSGISKQRTLVCQRFLEESVVKSKMDDSKNLDVCKEFFELMCDDIVKERMRLGGDWVVNHGLYSKEARAIVKQKLGSVLQLVVLDMSIEHQAKRLTKICLNHLNSPSEDLYSSTLEEKRTKIESSRKWYEAIERSESNIIEVMVTDEMSVEDVSRKITNLIL